MDGMLGLVSKGWTDPRPGSLLYSLSTTRCENFQQTVHFHDRGFDYSEFGTIASIALTASNEAYDRG
jgi:hypothetical protein